MEHNEEAHSQAPRFVQNLKSRLMGLGLCSCCSLALNSLRMEVLHLLDQLKTFCSRHAALLSLAAVASSLMYIFSGGDRRKPSSIRSNSSRSQSSKSHTLLTNSYRGDPGVSGLENVGRNWCYSNGLLQAMASCPVFCSWIEHLLRAPPAPAGDEESLSETVLGHRGVSSPPPSLCYGSQRSKMPLISELNAVIRGVNDANYGTGSLKGMYEALESHGWQISEGEHDCHEMLSVLCDTIQSELEVAESAMGYTQKDLKQHERILSGNPSLIGRLDHTSLLNVAWLPHHDASHSRLSGCADEGRAPAQGEKNKTRVEDALAMQMLTSVRLQSKHMPFGGFFANQLQCLSCGSKHAARWDRFECISLQLPGDAPRYGLSLASLLESYTSPDLVEGVTCDHCSKLKGVPTKRSFYKRVTIGKLPELLVLHINRTVWTDSDNATYKRRDRVHFPMVLDMAAYTYTHAVNNSTVQSSVGLSGIRGLARLVEGRFSARLSLTPTSASVSSVGDEAASSNLPQKNSPDSVPSVTTPSKARAENKSFGSLFKFSKSSKVKSPTISKSKVTALVSPGEELKCSDVEGQSDSSVPLENSLLISTENPASNTAEVPAERLRREAVSPNTPSAADTPNMERRNGENVQEPPPHKDMFNGALPPSETVQKSSENNNIPGASSIDTNEPKKESCSSDTAAQNGHKSNGIDGIKSNTTNGVSTANVNGNSSKGMFKVSNSSGKKSTEELSGAMNGHNQEPSSDHSTPQTQRENSSLSPEAITAVNGPTDSPTPNTEPSPGLSQSGTPANDHHPSTSTQVVSATTGASADSSSKADLSEDGRTSTGVRTKRSSSEDVEHIALYELRAVIVHSGSASSGHFTTYRRGPCGSQSWYFTSDELVRRCDITSSIGAEPYMLFYERCQSLPANTAKLSSVTSALPFTNSKKASRTTSAADTCEVPVQRAPIVLNDAAYFTESAMFA